MNIAHYGGTPSADSVLPTQPLDFDLLVLAELLTYFVVSQLTARHRSGQLIEVEDLVRLAQLWQRYNGYKVSRLQRKTVARRAQDLAARVERTSETTFNKTTTATMFIHGLSLDFRSPSVVDIFLVCTADLLGG